MLASSKKRDLKLALLILIFVLALFRLILLDLLPFMGTTEARYAEIARKMVELNDWITPWIDYGVPFWGKPPLSFWVTAASFKVFGVSEFTARLPHYVCGLFIIWLVWNWAERRSREEAFYSVVLLCAGLLYYLSSGAVMTDMWLLLGTTLSMRGFWSAVVDNNVDSAWEGWLFFIGLGIGLLAKGPIAVVLTGLPIFAWLVVTRRFSAIWTSLPWIRGCVVTMAIAFPWYVMAEFKTPGFLNYFLVGEHFERFVTPGWQGDLYGTAHDRPRGTIWLYMLVDWLPWSILFPALFIFLWLKGKIYKPSPADKEWRLYLLMWGLTPAVFFSAAGNVLWPYVLPGFPGMALYLVGWLANQRSISNGTKEKFLLCGLAITLIFMGVVTVSLTATGLGEKRSAKSMIALFNINKTDNEKIIYFGKRPFSAAFYSNGKAEQALGLVELNQLIGSESVFLLMEKEAEKILPDTLRNNLQSIGIPGKYKLFYFRQ